MVSKRATLLGAMLRAGKQQRLSAARLIGALVAPPASRKKAAASSRTAAAPGRWLSLHFSALTARMRYWLYLPASVPPGAAMPLLVMLHGCEQTATSFAEGSRMNTLAEKAGYAVLYPQQSATAHPQRCWKWYDRATQQGGGDAATIAALVRAVLLAYPVDRSRIYIAGISAGAAMAHIVALHHPDLFAAVGLHSGPVFGAGHSTIGALGVMQHGAASRSEAAIAEVLAGQPGRLALPTIVIHGEDDTVVRPVNQMQLAGQAMHLNGSAPQTEKLTDKVTKNAAATSRTRAYQVRDVLRGRQLVLRLVRIAGLQHAWSGGDPRYKFNAALGPDAGKMMLAFFARQRLI